MPKFFLSAEAVTGDTLVLTEEYDGIPYETLVYCYDGMLRELFAEAGYEQELSYGEEILPAAALQVSQDGAWLQMEITFADAAAETLILHLRSGEGAAA